MHLVKHRLRDADAARLSERLQACGDVDDVAEQFSVAKLDLTKIDSYSKVYSSIGGKGRIHLAKSALDLQAKAKRFNRRFEVRERTIPHRLEDFTSVLRRKRAKYIKTTLDGFNRRRLVHRHMLAILHSIGKQDSF
ncbi:hypothetical protein J2Y48_002075 [Mycoplana sp. BE70]|nr:hypothetical protein [Mycoplana sp. BE70]